MLKTKHEYWKTANLYLAAFLFSKNSIVVGIDATERRAIFSFLDSPERQTWQEEFESGTPMIDVRIYICALETLKQKRLDALMQSDGEQQ